MTTTRGVRSRQLREHFSELPQPAPFKAIDSNIDDSYLKGLESYIDSLSTHILKVQNEELEITKQFTEALKALKNQPPGKRTENEEKARSMFLKKISDIREKRKQFREMLYDALQERRKLWDSSQIQKEDDELVKRKMGKLLALPEEEQARVKRKTSALDSYGMLFIAFQVIIVVMFGAATEYPSSLSDLTMVGNPNRAGDFFNFYSNIALMVFVGFGFMMSSYKKYGLSAVGLTFSLAAFALQWAILTEGFFSEEVSRRNDGNNDNDDWRKIQITLDTVLQGLYGATATIVALGTVFGRTTPVQQILFTAAFIPLFSVNRWVGYHLLDALDLGGSIYVFTFGSIFGLAFALTFSKYASFDKDIEDLKSKYESDLVAAIGTIFLWVMWPSFNAALAPDATQHRVIVNTVLSLCSSVIFTFVFSRTFRGGKFNMADIQRGSIAGGIAMGSIASYLVGPGAAMVTGAVAGGLTTLSFAHIGPVLKTKLHLQDTIGVFSVYLVPGIIGAFNGILSAGVAADGDDIYGKPIEAYFPDREERQAGWNFLAFLITCSIAAFSGLVLGVVLRTITPEAKYFYTDELEWDVPHDFDFHIENTPDAQEKK